MTLKVNEIFKSIQGESTFAGLACAFVRLTGCNLRCSYCDTRYAFDQGTSMDVQAIISQIKSMETPLVEITGGEPLFQDETQELITRLADSDLKVLLETNGSIDVSGVDKRCTIIMDVKCPSSNMADQNDPANLGRLKNTDQVKFVISDWHDFEFGIKTIKPFLNNFDIGNVLFSPNSSALNAALLSKWLLDSGLGIRLNMQLHKTIWPDTDRGV